MKRLMYGGVLSLFLLMGITACEKETNSLPVPSKSRVTTDGNMLVFQSMEAYEDAVNDLDDEKQEAFLNEISPLKYDNYFSVDHPAPANGTTPEMDNFLGQLLNKDGVIQIGNHVFRVDLNSEQVFVLDAAHKMTAAYEDLLKGNTANKQVQAYSTGDDVLHLINDPAAEKCGGIGGGTYPCYASPHQGKIVKTFTSGVVWRLNPSVKFFRAGIYFKLSSQYDIRAYSSAAATGSGSVVGSIGGAFYVEMFCRYPRGWYKKRPCNSGSIGTQTYGLYYTRRQAYYQRTFYSGTRNLNGYYFYVQGRVRYLDGSVTGATPYGGRNINSPY